MEVSIGKEIEINMKTNQIKEEIIWKQRITPLRKKAV